MAEPTDSSASSQTSPPVRNVAIFIDMENLFGGYAGDVSQVPITAILDDIREATAKLQIGSTVAVTRAYANWSDSRLGKYRREMMEHGVEPVQVFSFSSVVKNAADIEMVVDVLEVADRSPHVTVFVLVSGDGGFVPLIRRLHALGKYVMVATTRNRAEESTSKLLLAVADYFLVSGVVPVAVTIEPPDGAIAPQSVLTTGSPSSSKPELQFGSTVPQLSDVLAAIEEVLFVPGTRAIASPWADESGRINGAALGKHLHDRWSNLAWKDVGTRTLGELLQTHFKLEVQRPASGEAVPIATGEFAKTGSDESDPTKYVDVASEDIEPGTQKVGAQARLSLKSQIHEIVSTSEFEIQLRLAGGKFRLSPLGAMLKRYLTPEVKDLAGFSSLTLALRYCLSGSAFCLVGMDDDSGEVLFVRREWGEGENALELPDIDEDELSSPQAVWELARRSVPPLVLVGAVVLVDVCDYLMETKPAGSIIDLIDLVAEALPHHEALHIRGSLNLLRRCGVLVGPTDYLTLPTELTKREEFQVAIREHLMSCLRKHGWPIREEVIDSMVGLSASADLSQQEL